MPITAGKVATYTCKYHHWQSWRHYGCKMDESGCKLKGGLFDCPYYNAADCPRYEPREGKNDETKRNGD